MRTDLEDKCPCGCYLRIGKRKYCNKKCYNKFSERNSYESQKKRANKLKKYLAEKVGSKCSKCGYNENLNALSFVHKINTGIRIPKLFPITISTLSNRSRLSLVRECNKCNLLCLNCQAVPYDEEVVDKP